MSSLSRLVAGCVCLAVLLAPTAYAGKKPVPTIEEIRAAVQDHWKTVRDITVVDRMSLVEYRHFGPLPMPVSAKQPVADRPNVWRMAPGLEYLELWQGGKYAAVAFDGVVTRWQGRRTAFSPPVGRIHPGHDVPFHDLSFAYYVGRFGKFAGLADFLALPTTRLVKANTSYNEIPCHRIEGPCEMALEGDLKTYHVRLDLAPDYGWMPLRARIGDAATGLLVREYKVRSFFNTDAFPFPREAQVDIYEVGRSDSPNARPRAILTSSQTYFVEQVAVNQGLGPGDFTFGFEPGCTVTDERTGQTVVIPVPQEDEE